MSYGKEIDAQILEIINRRELQMIVHSCIYYRMGTSLWSDAEFDGKARELVKLIKDHPEIFEKSHWVETFRDWDATTGFHLPIENPDIQNIAKFLVEYHAQTENKQNGREEVKFTGGTNIPTISKEPSRTEKKPVDVEIKVNEKPKPMQKQIDKPKVVNNKNNVKQNKLF
jgi:hypothetical protein